MHSDSGRRKRVQEVQREENCEILAITIEKYQHDVYLLIKKGKKLENPYSLNIFRTD
jgi:hypothetical protein